MWLAPNVLTFSGFLCVITAFAVVSFYDWEFYASSDTVAVSFAIPNWVWLFCGIATFAAHVLDGTDGKQARRTGASGPTGELFDHGIDSWLTLPFTLTMFSIFGRADFSIPAFRLMLILISVQVVFVASHWEKYNTGVLFLSWGYDLSQYSLAAVYLITYFAGGTALWKFHLFGQVDPARIMEILFYASTFAMSLPMSLYNIHCAYQNKTGKMLPLYEALLPMFSTVTLFVVAVMWAAMSRIDVINNDPRSFMLLMGTIFSNIACRLIIAQMTNTRAQPMNLLVIIYGCVAALCVFVEPISRYELIIVRVATVVVIVAHIHYAVCVVNQMCDHFGIKAFSLQKKMNTESGSNEKTKKHQHVD